MFHHSRESSLQTLDCYQVCDRYTVIAQATFKERIEKSITIYESLNTSYCAKSPGEFYGTSHSVLFEKHNKDNIPNCLKSDA